jgi:hypothetical protein
MVGNVSLLSAFLPMCQTSVITIVDIRLSLSLFINSHSYNIWSIVWSLQPQAHFGVLIILKGKDKIKIPYF